MKEEMGKIRAVERDTITVEADDWEALELDVKEGETLHLFVAVDVSMDSQLDISIYVLSEKYVFEETFYPERALLAAERVQSIAQIMPIKRTETIVVVFDNRYSLFTEKEVNYAIEITESDKKSAGRPIQSAQIPSRKEITSSPKRRFLGLLISTWLFAVISIGVALGVVIMIWLFLPLILPAIGPFIAIATLLVNLGNWCRGRKSGD